MNDHIIDALVLQSCVRGDQTVSSVIQESVPTELQIPVSVPQTLEE